MHVQLTMYMHVCTRTKSLGTQCMYKGTIFWGHNRTVHVATRTYVQSQVRALCHVQRTRYQRVVVKMNPSTEDTCNNTGGKHRVQKATIAITFKGLTL